jgi:thiol:disulfide interchange protein
MRLPRPREYSGPIMFITSSPITQPTPPRIKAPTKQATRIIIVASRLFPRQTLQKQLSTLQKRTFTTSTVRMVNVVTSAADFKSSIKSGVSVVDFYATWCGPCKVNPPDSTPFPGRHATIRFYGGCVLG